MSQATNVEIRKDLQGFVTKPKSKGASPGVIVIMEAYGLTGHVQGACRRLADAGYTALAPDFFHGEVIPYTDAPAAMAKVATLKDTVMLDEISAGLDWLDAESGKPGKNGIIGFCMGGRLAFLANCRFPARLQAAVGFYGGAIAPESTGPDKFGRTPPIGEAGSMQAPIYLGYGADDQGIPPAEHARVAGLLSAAKKRYTLAVYPGAAHAFLCEERANYAPTAAALAWRDIIDFLAAQLA
ncbi:MAG TPA: dienelactone hydrolase family protein [Gammaproteobacteria bacterium]|nr:dienelactone hydrolase family protein [Gammaproteobacteria bacterium]